MKTTLLLIFLFILSSAYIGNAQVPRSPSSQAGNSRLNDNPPSTAANEDQPPNEDQPAPTSSSKGHYPTSREFIITLLVSTVGLIALVMEFFMLRGLPKLKAEDILRVFAVTLILVGTLFFIAAGFDSTQIAPAMGLFGTVAGYLLGRSIDRKEDKGSE
jgi:hypothetical protein